MFRCQWIVSVKFVKFIGIFQVAFDDIPHVAVNGILMMSKSEISFWERKRKFSTFNGSDMAVP